MRLDAILSAFLYKPCLLFGRWFGIVLCVIALIVVGGFKVVCIGGRKLGLLALRCTILALSNRT